MRGRRKGEYEGGRRGWWWEREEERGKTKRRRRKRGMVSKASGEKNFFLPKLKKNLFKIRLSIRVRNFAAPNERLNIKKQLLF